MSLLGSDELLVGSVVSLISPGIGIDQVVGRVEATGERTRHTTGDLVFAHHPHQEHFGVRDDPALICAVPDGLAPERAVFATVVDVAVTALLDVPIRIGDAVVVYASGALGSLCAQLVRASAATVIVVDAAPARRALALEWGADAALHPDAAPVAIDELTAGRGADVTIDASGRPGMLQTAIEATGLEGTVVAVTFCGNDRVPMRLSPAFHYRRHRMVSAQISRARTAPQPRWSFARRMGVALELLRSERVHVAVEQAPLAGTLEIMLVP
jgi:threonine dehydrogenase-like Zn-dependent dehydrogenase